jgi:CRP-like cAMP-binding protein
VRKRPGSNHDRLADLEVLAGCSARDIDRLRELSTIVDLPAGHVLCREGSVGASFYVIVAGVARVTIDGADVAELGPGSGFGEVALLRRDGRRIATVTARTRVTVLVLTRPEFATAIAELPGLARSVVEESSRRIAENATGPAGAVTS